MNRSKEKMPEAGGVVAREKAGPLWYFLPENKGAFIAPDAELISRLYFPLMNRHGMKCSITPELKGDMASSFQHFLTPATVTEELHRNVSGRNFWVHISGQDPWSVAGNSAFQKADKWTEKRDESEVEGHIGAFILRRRSISLGLESEVTVFVPDTDDFVELMKVSVKNISDHPVTFTPTSATAIFGRHADHFRDHRQVTTMFQKVFVEEHGVRVKPTIMHDERGHSVNHVQYAVLGFETNGSKPVEIWPVMSSFIGEGGSLDNPEAVFKNLPAPVYKSGDADGREAIGVMRFSAKTLGPGETAVYIILHGITVNKDDLFAWKKKFGSTGKFDQQLEKTLKYWQNISNAVSFHTANSSFDNWTKWIAFQLKCRQVFGNSYLPDFGYGRGGRGWRDLWQDLLSIFLVDPTGAREEMLNNFMGIRVDGSNATIIGTKPGEFIADRNNLPRTWCDHGAWPVFVLQFYIHQTGDDEILWNEIPYWKDVFTHRSKDKDPLWDASQGHLQLTEQGGIYKGTMLEHVLLQQLTAFFNVGHHNNLLLEGGDWNDTLDMGREKGESVCFHSFYGYNLAVIAGILERLGHKGYEDVYLLQEILMLLDRLPNKRPVNYDSPESKQERLSGYFQEVKHTVSGNKAQVKISDLVRDLRDKSAHIMEHIRKNEWIETTEGYGFFNGHYDNNGIAIHGDSEEGVLMDLTSQVLPVMCEIADENQVAGIYRSAKRYLKDSDSSGLRLCTDFKRLNLNIGRITGFTYGYKEHGSKWSQQNIMFTYALYKRGFVKEGYEVFNEIFNLSTDSGKALIFPGIPSYFEPGDRGAYAYLTGSSAWLLLTLTTQVFGVDGYFGDLLLHPKLDPSFFDPSHRASIQCRFRELTLEVIYTNQHRLSCGEYSIGCVTINNQHPELTDQVKGHVLLPYSQLLKISENHVCRITIDLVPTH